MPIFKFRNSTSSGAQPANGALEDGEIAINVANRRIFEGTAAATTVKIVDTIATQTPSTVNISGGSISVTNLGTSTAAATSASSLILGGTTLSATAAEPSNSSSSAVPTNASVFYRADELRGKLKNVFTFTSSGTYTKSGSDVTRLHVIVMGGGGGGRAYSECGGSGGYAEKILDATSISTVSVTIGGAGIGGVYFGFSPGGGTTSFGSFVSASGGDGANSHIQHNGGRGGIGSGGELNARGGGGGGHNNMDQYSGSCAPGGEGGIGFFGGGTPGAHASGAQPADVASWGAGGVAVSPSHNGQGGRNGRGGICIIYEYK
jgi:hypothetical protein